MKRYRGLPYPIEKTAQGLFATASDIAQIKASMLTIIMTVPGERVCNPHFGTPLNLLANKPAETIIDEARIMIAKSLKRWEKRIQVADVQVILVPSDMGYDINIQVFFIDPIHMQEPQSITLQIPLEEYYV